MMKVLVYRIGQLGDSIIALPALWSARRAFPDAEFTLLSDSHPNSGYVGCAQVYEGTRVFADFIAYPVRRGRRQLYEMGKLLWEIRQRNFDLLIYLAPVLRAKSDRRRDALFFRGAGIKRSIGFDGYDDTSNLSFSAPLPLVRHEADELLTRLRAAGIGTPADGCGCMDLKLGEKESRAVDSWLGRMPTDDGRAWIGVGPGSKMPSKVWPVERFAESVATLVERYSFWPVVFGGPADREIGNRLVEQWGCGFNAAGQLALRESAEALRRCRFYLGNDTGTMHLAAAVGTRCIAIFSSREHPGRWYPYGKGHTVLRTPIDCEGCMLVVCGERHNECLNRITVDDVVHAAERMLQSSVASMQAIE
jgi:ADP-heptose:LPS heptosyltransferase